MVEAVGSLSKLLGRTIQSAAPVSAVASNKPTVTGVDEARLAATDVARDLSAAAPVNHARVAQIKQAIADGTYTIAPEAIADRLAALKLDWTPGDR